MTSKKDHLPLKIIFIVGCFIFSIATVASAQKALPKELQKKMDDADAFLDYQDYNKALKLYKEVFQLDSSESELSFKIGLCMYNIRPLKKQSLTYFEKAVKGNDDIELYYYLGNAYHQNLRFEDAIKAYHKYKSYTEDKDVDNAEIDVLIAKSKTAVEMMKHPINTSITNMGSVINSKYPDYVPLISADESIMIFTSRREGSTGGLKDPNGDFFEDIYISHFEDGAWTPPKGISSNINTNTHDACVALSPDGQILFVYRTSKDLVTGDIYASVFDGTDWTVPALLGSDINTPESRELSASITTENDVLYFSSDRAGGYGGLDIYKANKLPNGDWGKVQNLGPIINTAYDDDAPFIHPNGKTLYFSSKGHKNMGDYDIFKSTIEDDGLWSEPQNLGYPVNTVDNDIYFVLSADNRNGYYSSITPDGLGETDIYQVKFPEEINGSFVIKGVIIGSDPGAVNGMAATVTLVDDETQEEQGVYNTNRATGKFILIVSPFKRYKMTVEADGYVTHSEYINSMLKSISTKLEKQ